jgi:hypothetical protein
MHHAKAQLRVMRWRGTLTDMNPIAFLHVQAVTREAVRGAGPDPGARRPQAAPAARRTARAAKPTADKRTPSAARPVVERSG